MQDGFIFNLNVFSLRSMHHLSLYTHWCHVIRYMQFPDLPGYSKINLLVTSGRPHQLHIGWKLVQLNIILITISHQTNKIYDP